MKKLASYLSFGVAALLSGCEPSADTAPDLAPPTSTVASPLLESPSHPNIVMVMLDDADAWIMNTYMPRTKTRIRDNGVSLTRFFTSYSTCAPSGSSFLTGKYPHNHGVNNNIKSFDK